MEITRLTPETYPRWEHFRHFWDECACAVSLCDDVDVTGLCRACHDCGVSFYIAMLWCVSKVINAHAEFRMTTSETAEDPYPVPAVFDEISPAHNVFHEDSETYTTLFTKWSPDFAEFAECCAADLARAKRMRVMSIPAPDNTFEASCVPWRHFTSVGVNCEAYPLTPTVAWGGFTERDGRTMMPLSIQIHHAAADGFHLARFLNETEAETAYLAEELIKIKDKLI
ncbi:MAG: chloramphenicol acetyltransferase CAT [Clostridia bacterium]|nr:chloramphenicol acetyltransferase CAT [Clostridia bacterium]